MEDVEDAEDEVAGGGTTKRPERVTFGSKRPLLIFSSTLTIVVDSGTLCLTSARVRRSLHEIPWILELDLTSLALSPKMPSAKLRASRKDCALVAGALSWCRALK